jgi:SAM-dependent methyltransferase
MPESVSFDRAADFYDETRKLSDTVASAVTTALALELENAGADHLLEIGIGTGRITRPLMERGVRVTGIDISSLMMGRLLSQLTPQHRTPDLLLGDATALPFSDGSMPAILAVHVLHLVSSAEKAIDEIKRILAPGGIFLHQTHRDTDRLSASAAKWDEMLKVRGSRLPGRSTFTSGRSILEGTGAQATVKALATEEITLEPSRILRIRGENPLHWRIPSGVLMNAGPNTNAGSTVITATDRCRSASRICLRPGACRIGLIAESAPKGGRRPWRS